MNETLKGKLKPDMNLDSEEACGFTREDVKSAVEWLKSKSRIATDTYVLRLIDEAFEDVIKKWNINVVDVEIIYLKLL